MGAYQTSYNAGPSSTLKPGMIPRYDGRGPQIISLKNDSRAAQIETLLCTGTSYAVTLTKGGVSRAFSGSGFAGASASAQDLKDSIDNDGIASGWVSTSIATATVTCTARFDGTDHDVTYSGTTNVTATETTSASDGNAVGFGLAVMHGASDGVGIRPTKTTAVAQVNFVTPTAVNSQDYFCGVQLLDADQNPGDIYMAEYVSDGSATVAEITAGLVAALNVLLPASTVLAADVTTYLSLTAEVAGVPFRTLVGGATTATMTVTENVANVTPDFTYPLAGFAVKSNHVGAVVDYSGGEGSEPTEYPAAGDVSVMEAGIIVVETDDSVSRFDPVYIRITATGNEKVGSVRNDSDSGDAILLSGARFLEAASGSAAAHAPVRIQFDLSGLTS